MTIRVTITCDDCHRPLSEVLVGGPGAFYRLKEPLSSFAVPAGGEARHGGEGKDLRHSCYTCLATRGSQFRTAAEEREVLEREGKWSPPKQVPDVDRSWQKPGVAAEWHPGPGGGPGGLVKLVRVLGPDTWAIEADHLPGPAWAHACNLAPIVDRPPPREEQVPMRPGLALIAAERERQVSGEGFNDQYDDRWEKDELAWAAASYAVPNDSAVRRVELEDGWAKFTLSPTWPWMPDDDKRLKGTRVQNLTKAGALIAAELDRLLRIEAKKGGAA